MGLLLPSDFIGRPGRAQSAFDVQALGEVTICRFERRAFERMVRDTPHIATRLLTMSLNELDAPRDWAVVLGWPWSFARSLPSSTHPKTARKRTCATNRNVPEHSYLHTRTHLAQKDSYTLLKVSKLGFEHFPEMRIIEIPQVADEKQGKF